VAVCMVKRKVLLLISVKENFISCSHVKRCCIWLAVKHRRAPSQGSGMIVSVEEGKTYKVQFKMVIH